MQKRHDGIKHKQDLRIQVNIPKAVKWV